MKTLIRRVIVNFMSLSMLSHISPGLLFNGSWFDLIIASLMLLIINIIIKPLLKILFLPINLVTFGAFRWLINVVSFILLIFVCPHIVIQSFEFKSATIANFYLTSFYVPALVSLFINAMLLNIFEEVLRWIMQP